jgi:hypothetical protein
MYRLESWAAPVGERELGEVPLAGAGPVAPGAHRAALLPRAITCVWEGRGGGGSACRGPVRGPARGQVRPPSPPSPPPRPSMPYPAPRTWVEPAACVQPCTRDRAGVARGARSVAAGSWRGVSPGVGVAPTRAVPRTHAPSCFCTACTSIHWRGVFLWMGGAGARSHACMRHAGTILLLHHMHTHYKKRAHACK